MYYNNSAIMPYLSAANTRIIEKNAEDIPVLTENISAVESVFSRMQEMYGKSGYTLDWGTQTANTVPALISLIDNKQILFQNMITSFLRRNYRDVEAIFGVLPLPKFFAEQDTYSSNYSQVIMCGFVPITVQNTDPVGYILEAMADASGNITDTYNEVCLSSKFTRDEESYEMLKLAKENIVLDMAFYYGFGDIGNLLNTTVTMGREFMSTFVSQQEATATAAEKFAAELE